MSGSAQFGQHPDADSLNGFAEQALAVQERERIATHLAVCSRCREIVFLAQQAGAELQPAAAGAAPHTVERGPWFRNWRLAWVPVGALAAGITVAYVVHVHRVNTAVEMAQMANEVRAVSPPSVAPAPVTPLAGPERSTETVAKKSTPVREPHRAAVRPEAEVSTPTANEPVNALAGLKAGAEVRELSDQRTTQETAGAIHAVPQDKTGLVKADKLERRQFHVTAAATPLMQADVAPKPAGRSVAAVNGSRGTLAALAAKQMELPGGLPAVSTATVRRKVLAVDKAGAVFLSTDAGVHWNLVERQWTGMAVEVRTQSEVQAKADAATGGGSFQSVFELVNDQGQVWMSADGQSWKAE